MATPASLAKASYRKSNTGKLVAVGAFYIITILLLQWLSGAYSAGFGGDPDEPAHYVTGLMVRDYIAGFFPGAPLSFAENYYVHYPQVAFGHWPPLFHFLEAAWMLLFPVSRASILVLMAILTAACATALYALAGRELAGAWAMLCGLLFVALPITVTYASLIMAEIPLALFSTIALIFLVRLLEEETPRLAVGFGLAAAAAALVKPSGWALLMVPIPAALLMNTPRRLLSRWLWLGMALTLVIALPVHALTLKFQREGQEGRKISVSGILQAISTYLGEIPHVLGWVAFFLLLVGGAAVILALRNSRMPALPATASTFFGSVLLFHSVVPTTPEQRKLFMAVPIFALFTVWGLKWISDHLPPSLARSAPIVLAAAALAQPAWSDLTRPRREPAGFESVARFILSRPDLANRAILVSAVSTPGTKEGALVAEVAARDRDRPSHFVLRASKQLMHSTWNGLNYVSLFSDADQVRDALHRIPVGLIVVDALPGGTELKPHQRLLSQMLQKYGPEWEIIYTQPGNSGDQIQVFASTRKPESQVVHVEVDLRDKLNRVIHNTR